jgi:transposase
MAVPDTEKQLRLDSATVWDQAPGIRKWAYDFHQHVFLAMDVEPLSKMYEEGGRKPISPRLLASITVLQYMFRSSDREAVDHTLIRRDWRVALSLDSDYEGFHPTVLVRFRQRLIAAGLEEELFRSVLSRAKELGMLRGRRRLRVDATELLANVSVLSRADVVRETLRVVLSALVNAAPELEGDVEFERLLKEHGEESWLGGSCDVKGLRRLGEDGYALLRLCEGREVAGVDVLCRVLEENFAVEDGSLRPLEEKELSSDRVRTPHDPDARLGQKRKKSWIGDKVHVVETADGEGNLVVGVLVTDPRQEDSTVLEAVVREGTARVPDAEMLLADTGYASATNSVKAQEGGLRLMSPPRADTHKGGYRPSEFEIDFESRVARCPMGQMSQYWRVRPNGKTVMAWGNAVCAACPAVKECKTSARGRRLELAPHWERLQRERAAVRTDEFWNEYRHRAGVEATMSELVRRHDLRRSRYRGSARRRLHALLSVTALNTKRLLRWIAGGGSRAAPTGSPAPCAAAG